MSFKSLTKSGLKVSSFFYKLNTIRRFSFISVALVLLQNMDFFSCLWAIYRPTSWGALNRTASTKSTFFAARINQCIDCKMFTNPFSRRTVHDFKTCKCIRYVTEFGCVVVQIRPMFIQNAQKSKTQRKKCEADLFPNANISSEPADCVKAEIVC